MCTSIANSNFCFVIFVIPMPGMKLDSFCPYFMPLEDDRKLVQKSVVFFWFNHFYSI